MDHSAPDERFAVWDALSEFFLDTQLGQDDYERIATCLAQTDYSVGELEEILKFEVYPECISNLLDIAGE